MSQTYRAPKQKELTESESLQSFEAWRQNLCYQLKSDENFRPLFNNGVTWTRKTKRDASRGFVDDTAETVTDAAKRKTANQKAEILDLLLEQIANFAPIVSRRAIVNDSTSLNSVWQTLRLHYGFHSTGGNFIDFININLRPDERPETLYQRMRSFVDDNLLTEGCGITHHGVPRDEEDDIQPSLENLVVLIWLSKLHKDLPNLVKVKYGADLRSKTLASLKPEISQALDALLDELRDSSATIRRTNNYDRIPQRRPPAGRQPNNRFQQQYYQPQNNSNRYSQRVCSLCKAAGRSDTAHFLSRCKFPI